MLEISSEEIQIAKNVAKRESSYWKGIETAEVESDLFLWLCENIETVRRYRIEPGGGGKLYIALRHQSYHFMGKEVRNFHHVMNKNDGTFAINEIKKALKRLDDGPPYNERAQLVAGAFYGLKPKQQEILRLIYIDGESPKNIALATGRTYHAIKTWRTKAMSNLKASLSGMYYQTPETIDSMVLREAL